MIFAPFAFRNQVVVAATNPSPTPSLTPSISITPSITITPSVTPSVTPSITPTPTPTPSAAGVITVSWYYEPFSCATAAYSFRKNGSTEASGGGGTSASGTFTCIVGDILVAEHTSGIKGIGCSDASSQIDRNFATVASAFTPGFNVTATSTWTVTSGTTSVQMYAGAAA
jgi:hypothetical protein